MFVPLPLVGVGWIRIPILRFSLLVILPTFGDTIAIADDAGVLRSTRAPHDILAREQASHPDRGHVDRAQPQTSLAATDRQQADPGDAARHDRHAQDDEIHLSPEQRAAVALEISVLEPRVLGRSLRAPGEVRLNAYATAQVTPRIEAQVVARHARMGDQVELGEPLVTLSSVGMAEAQGDLVVAEREWQRLSRLKGSFVSESDYLEASVARQKALSRVLAYGMTPSQATDLVTAASEAADGPKAVPWCGTTSCSASW